MKKEVSIVLSRESTNYRALAREWFGLSEEQMRGMDVHHNPPRSQGGRNIPEHLFIYHPSLHSAVHGSQFTAWAREGGRIGGKIGGRRTAELRKGVCDPEVRRKLLEEQKRLGKGVYNNEVQRKRAKKGGETAAKMGVGVHAPENKGKGGRATAKKGAGFHTPEHRANCKNKHWWVNEEGKTIRSQECPGPDWTRGRQWRLQ
jgi:hypothetical protein